MGWRANPGGGGAASAAELPFTPAGDIAATNVQDALAEVASEKSTSASVASAISAAVGVTVQAYSSNLTSWAGIAPSAKLDASKVASSTTTGKLARFTDTAGTIGQSAMSEDGSGHVTLTGTLTATTGYSTFTGLVLHSQRYTFAYMNNGLALYNAGTIGWGNSVNAVSGVLDIGLCRMAAGVLGVGNGNANDASGTLRAAVVRCGSYTVATLPAAATAGAGAQTFVTDSNATFSAGIGNTVTGGGSDFVRVTSDGTNWRIM